MYYFLFFIIFFKFILGHYVSLTFELHSELLEHYNMKEFHDPNAFIRELNVSYIINIFIVCIYSNTTSKAWNCSSTTKCILTTCSATTAPFFRRPPTSSSAMLFSRPCRSASSPHRRRPRNADSL